MTPDERMTIRIASHITEVAELRAALQDLVQYAQEQFADDMSEGLRAAINRAKRLLAEDVQ